MIKYTINPKFINSISKKCVRLHCNFIKNSECTNPLDKLREFTGIINGFCLDEYNPLSNSFIIYTYAPNLTKKLKHYNSQQLLSRVENTGLQNVENKTLLDYATHKLKKENITINIQNITRVNWDKIGTQLKEKLILSALKNKNTILHLKESPSQTDNNNTIQYTQYHITVKSDENKNYNLIIKPRTILTSKKTVYELLKNNPQLELTNQLITTAITTKRKKPSKIIKTIPPTNSSYSKHVNKINKYYQEQKINFKVGGVENECLILLTDDGYTYHTKNSLLCEIINTPSYSHKDDFLINTISVLKKGGLIC